MLHVMEKADTRFELVSTTLLKMSYMNIPKGIT